MKNIVKNKSLIEPNSHIIANNQSNISICPKKIEKDNRINVIFKMANSELIIFSRLCTYFQNIYKTFACC
jgi:hypothetical protein